MKLKKGHIFQGQDGKGYILTVDPVPGDYIRPSNFEAFGGAPDASTWMVPGSIIDFPDFILKDLYPKLGEDE